MNRLPCGCPVDSGCDSWHEPAAAGVLDPEYADVDEAGQLSLGVAGEQRAIPGLAPAIQWQNDHAKEQCHGR